MVEFYRPEAQVGVAPFDNAGNSYSDVVTGQARSNPNREGLSASLQKTSFPRGYQAKADINVDVAVPRLHQPHIPNSTGHLKENGHYVRNYLNGTRSDEYWGVGVHEKTVWGLNGSWSHLHDDWGHGRRKYEEHDDSGVFKSVETQTRLTTWLRDPHGKLIFEMRQNKTNGDTTVIERGKDDKLITKHYRLA